MKLFLWGFAGLIIGFVALDSLQSAYGNALSELIIGFSATIVVASSFRQVFFALKKRETAGRMIKNGSGKGSEDSTR